MSDHSIKRFKDEGHETLAGLPARKHLGRKQKRVFRYQLAKIHVGTGSSALGSIFYRGGVDDKPKGGDFGTYFADELGEMTLGNSTGDYRKLKDEISDLVISRPLLLHNKKKVAARLLDGLKQRDTLAFEAFAKLTYFLCKDLGDDFIPFLAPFCSALLKGLVTESNVLKQKVSLVQNIFLTITGWLRVLTPIVCNDKLKVIDVLSPLIDHLMHKSHGISRLVGECLSVSVRKITKPEITIELVRKCIKSIQPHLTNINTNSDVSTANRAVGGLGTLMFECIRGVNGRWHSKFSTFVETLLPELENETNGGVLHLAFKEFIDLSTKHGNPASILELIDVFANTIKDCLASDTKQHATVSTCCICLKMLGHWDKVVSSESIRYMKTFLGETASGLIKLIKNTDGFDDDEHIPAVSTAVFELCLGWVQRSSLQPSIEVIMNTLLQVNCPIGVLSQNIASITAVPSFAANLRSRIVETVDQQCKSGSSEGNEAKLLLLIISLYEESQQQLSEACSQIVKRVVTSAADTFPEGVRWLGWKLASLLPEKTAKLAATAAVKIVNSTEESPIIVAHALQVLAAAKHAKLMACTQTALQKYPLSPSVAAAASQVVMETKIPKNCRDNLIEICGLQLRSSNPVVRQGGCSILRTIMEEDDTAVTMLDACSKGEALRANDMAENRLKVLAYDEVVGVIRRYRDGIVKSDSIQTHLTIAANILLGALTIRYRPLWAKAQEGLELIATENMSLFWPLFVKQLEVYKTDKGRDARRIKIDRRKAKKQEKADIAARKEGDVESDDESEADSENDESTEEDEESTQLEALWEAAVVDETSMSDATTMQSNFKTLWGLMESLPSRIVATCANDIFAEYKSLSAAATNAEGFLSHDAIIISFLRVLTRQESPDSLPISKEYETSLWDTLAHENIEVQKLSVVGLKHFQAHKKIAKYEDKITALVEIKGLKNRLLNLDFDEIRAENIQHVVYRLLRPKLWQNRKNTRQSVLQFVVGVNEVQFNRFMDYIVIPIMKSHQIFTRKSTKFLEFVTSIVESLGARLYPWLDLILDNSMIHLEGSYCVKAGFTPARHHREGRRHTLKLMAKLFRQFPEHEYRDQVGDNLSKILTPAINDLGNSAGAMGALISLLSVFAEDELLVKFLDKLNAIPAVCKLLGHPSVSIEVYTASLKMVQTVIEISPDTFTQECCKLLVSGIHTATSTHFKTNTKAWSASVTALSTNATAILEKTNADDKKTLTNLMSFLIDSLKNRKLRPTEQATEACTTALSVILPKMPEDSHVEFMSKMAKLFYTVKYCSSRAKLAEALSGIVNGPNSDKIFTPEIKKFLSMTCNLIEQTNDHTVDAKGESHYKFDTRISGFYACAEAFSKKKETANSDKVNITGPVAGELRALHLLPLCYNLAYYINDANQSIRTTSGLALRAAVSALKKCASKQGTQDIFTHVITPVVVQGARFGLKHVDARVQSEWLQVYGAASQLFSLTPGLSNQNSDFDFFHNITHPQASRQLKALAQFRQKSSELPENTLEQIFIPLFVNFLQRWSSKKKDTDDITVSDSGKMQALVQSLLQTFTTLAKHLSWHRYYRLVMDLLQHEISSSHAEKSMTACISQVLDGFHFLPTQEIKIKPVYEDEVADQPPAEQPDVQTSRIGDILIEKLIPAVHKFWKNSGVKAEDNASAIVGATVDKVSLVRLPLACTIIRLLKFVPTDVDIASVIDSIIVELVSGLKTKKTPQRESARETLADCLAILGAQYLKKIIHLLRSTLVHGYQLHVMGYTVVALLTRIEQFESDSREHIDDALSIAVDVLLDDNIGTGGSEKEVEELAKTMKELKKNRSLEGLELLAKMATPENVANYMVIKIQQMFTPNEAAKREFRPEEERFKRKSDALDSDEENAVDTIDSRVNLDLIQKVKTIMRRMARGIVKNKHSVVEELLEFSKTTLLENSSTRDAFLEKFEVKQDGMKVRLVDSNQATRTITRIRAGIKKDQLVQDEPVRKDRGFEKKEVNSQKRQLGSARRKGVAAGRKRIRIPEKAARTTLQSMECIDELSISIAWNIVNHSEKDSEKAKVSLLVSPMVTVLSGDSSDSVITLALLTLHEILKLVNHVITPQDQIESVLDLLFIVIERTGEIRSACFRLMAVLLLHRQAALNEQQALICCSLIRSDLDKKATFIIPSLHLLKAIVIRKIEIPEVYDLVPVIQEKMLHHANSAIVSQLAASVIARFLTDWRMTEKKLESHVDYVIQNLQYPVPEGRLALLHLLEVIFGRFPVGLIKKEIDYFFVPLAHRLMADDSKVVRKKTASALAALFQISGDAVNAILKIIKRWISGTPATQIIALQVLSVFFKQPSEMTSGKVSEFVEQVC